MARHRFLLEFESTVNSLPTSGSKAGWTELWYDTADTDAQGGLNRALSYAVARRKLLTPGWTVAAVRSTELSASFVPVRRSVHAFVQPAAGVGQYGINPVTGVPGVGLDEQPYDALEISMACLNGHQRNFQMRGIGNDWINAGGRFLNPARFPAPFAAWSGWVTGTDPIAGTGRGTSLAVRFRIPVINGVVVAVWFGQAGSPFAATALSPVVDLSAGIAIQVGDLVNFTRNSGVTGFRGVWQVSVIDGPQPGGAIRVRLAPKRRVLLSGAPVTFGIFSVWRYGLDPFVLPTPGYGVSRRTGRPAQVTRGRRSNRGS